MTIRCSGRAARSNTVSLVRKGTPSPPCSGARPGIGGTAADEPVAITKRRALIVKPPASTSSGPVNLACSGITLTPRPVKRSTESFGSIAAITPRTCSRSAA